ncbi:hypothetical protein NIM87_09510 [Devosia sp. XJ19-1]|uniref:Uncharacterized protein n=1 Tax=Devosia ureilytica TaxID=2952754 RepID=A0A9Q4API6_9HYPH|nr:hypothetical protein [Devosia ureilytica]MCP8883734.1 hypothetical protein [Devosia ureilytica]MCP8887342.1 hypothetical protein [Devosia ureilytica]
MPGESAILARVAGITDRLNRLRAIAAARNAVAATMELEGLANAVRQLDLALRVHLERGELLENHDEIIDFLAKSKAELIERIDELGLSSREKRPKPTD